MPYSGKKHRHSPKPSLFSKFALLFKEEKHHDRSGEPHSENSETIRKETFSSETLSPGSDEDIHRFLNKLANSTAMFMGTYIIAWFIYQLAVMYAASLFNIPSVLKYYELKFLEPNSSPLSSQMNIMEITFTGPLISVFLALISFIILKSRIRIGQQLKLFFMWFCINTSANFFGAFVAGFITRQGFGYVIAWMFIPYSINLMISVIFLSIMVYLSILLVPVLVSTTSSRMNKKDVIFFILSRLTIPWFIGIGLLILLKIPNRHPQHENIFSYDIFILISMFFVAVPPLIIKYYNYRRSLSLKGEI